MCSEIGRRGSVTGGGSIAWWELKSLHRKVGRLYSQPPPQESDPRGSSALTRRASEWLNPERTWTMAVLSACPKVGWVMKISTGTLQDILSHHHCHVVVLDGTIDSQHRDREEDIDGSTAPPLADNVVLMWKITFVLCTTKTIVLLNKLDYGFHCMPLVFAMDKYKSWPFLSIVNRRLKCSVRMRKTLTIIMEI